MSRLPQLQKLHAADPHDADVLYMLAQEHARAGDHAAAVSWYDRCLEADSAYHYAHFHKARSLEAMGDLPAAAGTLQNGAKAADAAGNAKALGEIEAYLDDVKARL